MENPFQKWTLTTFALVAVLILVIIQFFGLLFNAYLDEPILLGPGFLVLIVGVAVVFAFTLVKKQWQYKRLERKDIFALLIITVLTVLALMYFRDLVPEVFERSFDVLHSKLQSIVGII